MSKDEELFKKRLLDLANTAYQRNVITFTDFMGLNELNIFHRCHKEYAFIKSETYGGYESAERQIAAFIPDALYDTWNYPLVCLLISPLSIKFSEKLTHRDYLGAIINLGLERSKLGDIVMQEKAAYLFCHQGMGSFIQSELTRVKHTSVNCSETVLSAVNVTPNLEKVQGTVASIRLDSMLSLAYNSSRSSLVAMIEGGKVFVNGKLITSNAYNLVEADIVSVRGLGRFQYQGVTNQTKKGRYSVVLSKYI